MKKLCIALLVLLSTSCLVDASDLLKAPMTYWEKGNKGERLSYDEFKTLMSELERCMVAFRERFTKINIGAGNFSYDIGKTWEVSYKSTVSQFDIAFECLRIIKKYPNQIAKSILLYVVLKDFNETAADFARIESFEKQLGATHIELSLWTRAFQKAHLNRLAEAKDTGNVLYSLPEEVVGQQKKK